MDNTPFSQHISHLSRGMLEAELTEELAAVVKAVRETRLQGTLTLSLKIKMHSRSDEDTVIISPSVKTSKPKLETAPAIMFSTADGDLLRNDPNQPELELKEISKEPRQLKQVNG